MVEKLFHTSLHTRHLSSRAGPALDGPSFCHHGRPYLIAVALPELDEVAQSRINDYRLGAMSAEADVTSSAKPFSISN